MQGVPERSQQQTRECWQDCIHMKQPLEWQVVIHANPLSPARPRHVALLRDIPASAYSSMHYLMKSFFAPLLHFKPMMACCQH